MPELEYPLLNNSPVSLAILEIRYVAGKELDINSFPIVNHLFAADFPIQRKGQSRQIEIDESQGKPKATIGDPRIEDYLFISENKEKNFKVSLERFNFNQNGNYKGWDLFIEDCKRVWEIYYNEFFNKVEFTITGISIRFINKIEIPIDKINQTSVFKTTIYAEPGVIPDTVNSYLIKYTVPFIESDTIANVIQSLEAIEEDIYPFMFDIDVIMNRFINPAELWHSFSYLREIKNKIFFSNITDETLKLIS